MQYVVVAQFIGRFQIPILQVLDYLSNKIIYKRISISMAVINTIVIFTSGHYKIYRN